MHVKHQWGHHRYGNEFHFITWSGLNVYVIFKTPWRAFVTKKEEEEKENFQLKLWTILLSTSAIKSGKYLLKSINLSLLFTRSPLLYHQSHHHRSSLPHFHFKIYSSSAFYIHSFYCCHLLQLFVDDQQKLSKWTLPSPSTMAWSCSINLVKQKKTDTFNTSICISSFTFLIWIYWNLFVTNDE